MAIGYITNLNDTVLLNGFVYRLLAMAHKVMVKYDI
jgi:hypothetical protein